MNNYADMEFHVGTTTFVPCKHNNGWWGCCNIKVLWIFTVKKNFFFCNDCCKAITKEEMENPHEK